MQKIKRNQIIEEIMVNLHVIMKKMKKKTDDTSEPFCINHSQWLALDLIENNKETSIKAISNKLELSSSAITQLVDDLVSKGYVIREEDPNDRRSVQLTISPKGKKEMKSMKKKHLKEMEIFFAPLTNVELKIYLKLHKKLALSFFK